MQRLAQGQNEEIEKVNRERKYHKGLFLFDGVNYKVKQQKQEET